MYFRHPHNNIPEIIFLIFIIGMVGYCIFCLAAADRANQIARDEHDRVVLSVCEKTCHPYIVDLCYFGDKNNVFIGCANDKEKLITKPIK